MSRCEYKHRCLRLDADASVGRLFLRAKFAQTETERLDCRFGTSMSQKQQQEVEGHKKNNHDNVKIRFTCIREGDGLKSVKKRMKRKKMWRNERAAVRRRKEGSRRKTKTGKGNRAKLQKESWKKTKRTAGSVHSGFLPQYKNTDIYHIFRDCNSYVEYASACKTYTSRWLKTLNILQVYVCVWPVMDWRPVTSLLSITGYCRSDAHCCLDDSFMFNFDHNLGGVEVRVTWCSSEFYTPSTHQVILPEWIWG